ncbi:MAG: adenosylcobalamin-dependent ribonucleoside-diphosphate reductase [Gammaproteobacteria bacterium]|nr:adenosylcobalamin-dependent ribonucleoside-diphosphate reductase [Gammaproteobacteria bacterium]
MTRDYFTTAIGRHIWDTKYRYRQGDVVLDQTIADTWRRIAHALASLETQAQSQREQQFFDVLEGFKFLPGGRIQAGAGTGHRVTLFNCFVMGVIEDSMDGIFDALKEGALTMQQGGGVGYDFSTLRPKGTAARSVGTVASGPLSFMQIWDSMCATILSTGARRGAMMGTLRCDHPDIEEFIEVKRDRQRLRRFNLSVLVSDAFMEAVRRDEPWALVFPVRESGETSVDEIVYRPWSGRPDPVPCRVVRRVSARALWDKLMRATYDVAEPGVLFIDRINRLNNQWYREHISASNPCGEIPLPAYGACDLGSINLTRFVQEPFSANARLDMRGIQATAAIATRMLDNVIDVSHFPLPRQQQQAHGSRRIGLGITGLADALIMLGVTYGGEEAHHLAALVMRSICHTAYRVSIELAKEKGAFPFFDKEKYLQGEFVRALPEDIRQGIATHGIRNSHLMAIAPTGTISLLADNVSSGLEPVFDFHYKRRVLELDGSHTEYHLTDYALRLWRTLHGNDAPLPPQFIDARSISPQAHLDMQAALQPYVDNAISKTINIPEDYDFAAFRNIYELAYDKGLKGCTTFRPNPVTGSVLQAEESASGPLCCSVEREAD